MTRSTVDFKTRIAIDRDVMAGKPVVRGTRITVEAILAHLADTPDLGDLLAAYPRLTPEDVRACLAFAEAQVQKAQRAPQA